jgi:hypothetical protein
MFARSLLVASFVVLPLASAAVEPAPTAFERFATDPDIVMAESREVGSLASLDATVKVTVLLATARADETRRMRGVRFDLSNNGGTERIYLDERELAKLKMEVALMERFNNVERAQTAGVTGATQVHGTESCWMPNPVRRILCPEIKAGADWNGLRLWTFGGAAFSFRDRSITELRELVERTVEELDGL